MKMIKCVCFSPVDQLKNQFQYSSSFLKWYVLFEFGLRFRSKVKLKSGL